MMKSLEKFKYYRIVDIAINKKGNYLVKYAGTGAEQGGFSWNIFTAKFKSLEGALSFLKYQLAYDQEEYKNKIKIKEALANSKGKVEKVRKETHRVNTQPRKRSKKTGRQRRKSK